jgi:hypothetical protein
MPKIISDDEWVNIQRALDGNEWNITFAARDLGIPRQTLQSRIKAAAAKGLLGDSPVLPGFRLSQSTTVYDKDGTVKRKYVQQKPEDGEEFALPDGHRLKGVSALVNASGHIKQQWLKTDLTKPSIEEIGKQIREALDGYEPPPSFAATPQAAEADLATVYPLADWHVGLLSWRKETQHNWDLKIGQQVIKGAMTRLIGTAPNSTQGVVLGLGDLMHADNYRNQTAKSGHFLDVDGRYPRVLLVSTQLIIFTVDLALQKHAHVIVRILPGNHDDQSAIAVTLAVAMYYANNDRVTVDDDAGRFWWWSWGKVLIGATHGDQAKMKDLPLIMANRNAEAWGRSKFRYIYTGHIHKETAIDSGVKVESFQTPVAPDSWTVGMGYCPTRSVTSITHHKNDGEIIRHKVNIV